LAPIHEGVELLLSINSRPFPADLFQQTAAGGGRAKGIARSQGIHKHLIYLPKKVYRESGNTFKLRLCFFETIHLTKLQKEEAYGR
jgi:hypothetical protein